MNTVLRRSIVRPKRFRTAGVVLRLAGGLCCLGGCGTSAAQRVEDVSKQGEALPFVANVVFDRHTTPGSAATQDEAAELGRIEEEAVLDTLRKCGAFAKVQASDAPDAEADPDVVIMVTITEVAGLSVENSTEGILLQILAWSTAGPASLWVPDSDYNPGITVDFAIKRTRGGSEMYAREQPDSEAGKRQLLALADRVNFTEDPWPYLGSLLVPPCVFKVDRVQVRKDLVREFLVRATAEFAAEAKEKLGFDAIKGIGVALKSWTSGDKTGTLVLGAKLPPKQHFTQFVVETTSGEGKVMPYNPLGKGRTGLVSSSKQCWIPEGAAVSIKDVARDLKKVRVRASDYAEKDVTFTFFVGGGAEGGPVARPDLAAQGPAALEGALARDR